MLRRLARPPRFRHPVRVPTDSPEHPNTIGVVGWYDANAGRLASAYESLPPGAGCVWFAGLLPSAPGLVIDVGAGTGRNAAWLAGLGHDVVAVEPSVGFILIYSDPP